MMKRLRAQHYRSFKIHVIDSRSASVGIGLLCLQVARWIEQGIAADQIAQQAKALSQRIRVLFAPRELTYLRRSKRIGAIKYLLGSLIGVTPVIEMSDGDMHVMKSARGLKQAATIIANQLDQQNSTRSNDIIGIAQSHGTADSGNNHSELLASYIATKAADNTMFFNGKIGPTIGTHVGPGAIGMAFIN